MWVCMFNFSGWWLSNDCTNYRPNSTSFHCSWSLPTQCDHCFQLTILRIMGIAVLICIFLLTNEIRHFFSHIVLLNIFFCVCSSRILSILKIFLLICRNSLYILGMNLLQLYIKYIFSQSVAWHFRHLILYFVEKRLLMLIFISFPLWSVLFFVIFGMLIFRNLIYIKIIRIFSCVKF